MSYNIKKDARVVVLVVGVSVKKIKRIPVYTINMKNHYYGAGILFWYPDPTSGDILVLLGKRNFGFEVENLLELLKGKKKNV